MMEDDLVATTKGRGNAKRYSKVAPHACHDSLCESDVPCLHGRPSLGMMIRLVAYDREGIRAIIVQLQAQYVNKLSYSIYYRIPTYKGHVNDAAFALSPK
jgi:hypothetical protein